MPPKNQRRYTQQTLQTAAVLSANDSANTPANAHESAVEEVSNMAEATLLATDQPEESPLTVQTLKSALQTLREGLSVDIQTQMGRMKSDIQRQITALRQEAKADGDALRRELSEHTSRLNYNHEEIKRAHIEIEQTLNDYSDRLITLEKAHGSLEKEYKKVSEKCMDLENRSRRQNLRIIGIKEGAEGGDPRHFVARFLQQVLGPENFTSPPTIDRAHRTLAPKPTLGDRPRAILARMHYFTEKETILRLSREKGKLSYDGSVVHIFPDISPEVGRLRASFNQVKPKLRDAGIPYSLYYPAKMTITVKGTRHVFTEPQAVEEFIRNIAPTANGDKDD
ncbi:unnamed protein product [Knipowitschia caucasica]